MNEKCRTLGILRVDGLAEKVINLSTPHHPPASPLPMRLPTARPSAMVSPPGKLEGGQVFAGPFFWSNKNDDSNLFTST